MVSRPRPRLADGPPTDELPLPAGLVRQRGDGSTRPAGPPPQRSARVRTASRRPRAPEPVTARETTAVRASTVAPAVPEVDSDGVPTIELLVARAQAGDVEAFGLIYDRYVGLVHRYVYYRVGSRTLTEDIVSETFLRAMRRIGSFSWQGRDLSAWLVTIARNLVVDHLKSSRHRLEVPTADMIESAPHQLVDGPESAVLSLLTHDALMDTLRRLTPEQQECLSLRFLQGQSVRETALALGRNEGAVKALQYRALRSLARMLPPGTLDGQPPE